jgi:hypothetical protein
MIKELKHTIYRELILHGFIKFKVGDIVKTSTGLVPEFFGIKGVVTKVYSFGEIRVEVIKGNQHHRAGGRLYLAKHHYTKVN